MDLVKTSPHRTQRMAKAAWEDHYKGVLTLCEDSTSNKIPVFFNDVNCPFPSIEQAPIEDYGLIAGYYCDEQFIYFVFNSDLYEGLDWGSEDFYVSGDFNHWSTENDKKWKLKPARVGSSLSFILKLRKDKCIGDRPMRFKFITASQRWIDVPWTAPNRIIDEENNSNYELNPKQTGSHRFYFEVAQRSRPQAGDVVLWDQGSYAERCPIDCSYLLFCHKTNEPMGVTIRRGYTRFRIFAPRASKVTLFVSEHLDFRDQQVIDLSLREEIYWECSLKGDHHGSYYYYSVEGPEPDEFSNFDGSFKVIDPYALALAHADGPGIVIDINKISKPRKSKFKAPFWHDLIIQEVHLRDLIAQAPIDLDDTQRSGFSGLTKWLKSKTHYLKDLGVNTVELQPIQEFSYSDKSEYHWGYMPVNYFSPSSQFASHPEKASQIKEFQDLVSAFHDNDLAVVLDVVYNHVGEPNSLLFLDKYHYFEVNDEGFLMNHSGCGNDIKAKAPMSKKLIIDSLKHMMITYGVDGFRFDLAELIGLEVLLEIEVELKKIKPSVILIAEPWSFKGHIGYALKGSGYASWNDGYRKFITQYVKGESNQDAFSYYIKGSTDHLSRFPAQSINYSASHDDHCWIDKITDNPDNDGSNASFNDVRRTHLMCALLMSSLGVPMLSQGVDMLHSKNGVSNTYQRGDLNALDYHQMIKHSGTHQYFKRWIEFRKSPKGRLLRLEHRPSKRYLKFYYAHGLSSMAVLYNADRSLGRGQILFAMNPHDQIAYVEIKDLNLKIFRQIADHERFNTKGLSTACMHWHNGVITMPPLSCGLWVSKGWLSQCLS